MSCQNATESIDVYPDRARYLAGEDIAVVAESDSPLEATLSVRSPGKEVCAMTVPLAKGRNEIKLGKFPSGGYSVALSVKSSGAQCPGLGAERVARTAFDVSAHEGDYVRYGFLSDFAPDGAGSVSPSLAVEQMARYHITHVQFYDWMYRHHGLIPPTEEFTDAMGRRLSLAAVRGRISECARAGMVPVAYAAVYGAEREWFSAHPDHMLYREDGAMVDFIGVIGIADVSSGPWVDHFIGELRAAVESLGFGGFHLDQYGFPKTALSSSGRRVDIADCFLPLINRAKSAFGGSRAIIFNCVNGWPLERVAGSEADATYIEVWDPNSSYNDLATLVRRARALSPGKTAILAAYMRPFAMDVPEGEKERATLLARAVISANGGDHLVLGEECGILREGYYANHGHYRASFAAELRTWQDFIVRYRDLLFAHGLEDVSRSWCGGINDEIRVEGAPFSVDYAPGTIAVSASRGPLGVTVNLINLMGIEGSEWNVPRGERPPSPPLDITVFLPGASRLALMASPDLCFGDEIPLSPTRVPHPQGAALRFTVPGVRTWTMLHVPFAQIE